jgi:hypothetical protein
VSELKRELEYWKKSAEKYREGFDKAEKNLN